MAVFIFDSILPELNLVEAGLTKHINSNVSIINDAAAHLIKAGGKRMRPAFVLLAAKYFKEDIKDVILLAEALELIHVATLVHDDLVDNSDTRRGAPTVRSKWGNRTSIYTGNYIFAHALTLLETYDRSDILEILAETSMKICDGEINQMLSCYNTSLGLKNYLRRIERKTALLISVSCQLGAMVSNAEDWEIKALKNYGYYLGMAFQITDDILDLVADEKTLGKPTGSDIRQGVITLPAIYALHHDPRREELKRFLGSPELCISEAERILDIILGSDGVDYASYAADRFADLAQRSIRMLPSSPLRETFIDITDFMSSREY
ncbi:MAG TPA: polyprenyl synthetase family protein [Syntrophomonadaceae bacterium]|nr:polyprenyl synthetase family protein [Syntrophomonadaceae bacterium]HRX20472.1 polyprenyl synthetase family protein [Syntrophomonadaceae bacterium]